MSSELQNLLQNILNEKTNVLTPQNIVNGVNIFGITGNYQGTIINNQDKVISPSTSIQNIIADNGYTGLNQVTINAIDNTLEPNLVSQYIANGVNIFGVTGNFEGGTNTSDANAVSSDILINKTAYVNGTKLTGTMSYLNEINTFDITMNSGTNSILFNGTNISSNGYINNSSVFSMNISNSDLANYMGLNANVIANGVTILDITGVYEMDSDTMNLIQNQANMINSLESQLANLQNTLNTKGTAELNQEEYEEVVDTANDILGEEESE